MEEAICFFKVNNEDIPILDFDDPVWNSPENYFPVEFLSDPEIPPILVPEVKQDEAGTEAVHRSSNNFNSLANLYEVSINAGDGVFRLEDFITPAVTTIPENKTATVDIDKISFNVLPSPTGVMITISGVRYAERLCLDVFEFLNVFKFIFSDQCLNLKDDGLIYGSEKDRKRVLDLSKPGVIIFSPTLHAHWIKLYGTLHLRLVRHGRNTNRAQCIYLNTVNIAFLQSVGTESVLRKIITFQESSVNLPDFFPVLLYLYDDGTVMSRNFHLLDQLIMHSQSNWRSLIGYI